MAGISPIGIELIFYDVFPGSISDSNTTKKSVVISWVDEEYEIMSDRGFFKQDLSEK